MVDNSFQPMDFGEVFANTFTVIRRTFSRAGIIVFLLLLGGGLFFAWSNMNYVEGSYNVLSKFVGVDLKTDLKAAQEMQGQFFAVLGPFLLGVILFLLLTLVAQSIATVASWEGVNNYPVEIGPLMRRSLGKMFFYNLLQSIALGLVIVIIYAIAGIVAFAAGSAGSISPATVVAFVLAFLVILVIVLLTMFRLQEVDVDERGPFRSLGSSIRLFMTNKWRAAGPILAFAFAFGAISILLSVLMVGDTSGMMGMSSSSGKDLEAQVAALAHAKSMMTWKYFLPKAFIDAFGYLFLFNLITVVYTDLRIRRGDYVRSEQLEAWERDV
ncbi:MAG: hypothetical protein JWQ98_1410 [Chlorobi bacterium]|nr:hypothetical protein [Chlorobiota bacterium]